MTHDPYEYRNHLITIFTAQNGNGTWTWSYVIGGTNIEGKNIGGRVKTEKEAIRDAKIGAEAEVDDLL